VQFGGFGSMENHIAKKVVATSAVPSATTNKRMVAIAVQNPIAKRALSVTVNERDAKPAPQHANKEGWLIVELRCLRGRGVHVHASSFSADKVEVGTPRPAS